MKFLVDAQLSYRLVDLFRQAGLDTVHTLDLTLGNRTPNGVILELSVTQQRVVATKGTDFVDSFWLACHGSCYWSQLETFETRNLKLFFKRI